MDPQGSFLNQILCLKQEIDQLNVRVGLEIRETIRLESELVRCAEDTQEAVKDEKELLRTYVIRENEYSDLHATSVNQETMHDLSKLKSTRDALKKKITEERDTFIAHCRKFQQAHDEAFSAASVHLRRSIRTMNEEIVSREALIAEKNRRNDELQQQVDAAQDHNCSLLIDIANLKKELQVAESKRKLEPLEILEEEKRQLQDCILALKSRLASIQERKREIRMSDKAGS
ncbi:eisosome protein 1-like isoform X2 [Selaginella moellendorffii]|uniref:eisosome protein 1-like isoform X2 n=1 Tax=Selaginella moellendorffii TaxID=88036 RepID=UPI000D1C4A86|nr:eisosome protein 1-like isoform X2 [Selaginella moellendorffii]|eukprot:XP_024538281.1 eisosome protein 1-like isoform X2 [Selaginella moellendorffii]